MAMDTEREKEIGLGPKWPFKALNQGECLAYTKFSSTYDVKAGDEIYFTLSIANMMKAITF